MKITINGKQIEAKAGDTILNAARRNQIEIPTLCHLQKINEIGACRMCIVEVSGVKGYQPACTTKVAEGMDIYTDTDQIRASRRRNLELICADHTMDCTNCSRGVNCELRALCQEYEVDDRAFGIGYRKKLTDKSTVYLERDNSKCILCRRCMSVCGKVQGIGAVFANFRGKETKIGFGVNLSDTNCIACGQCIAACPTGALSEKDDTKQVWKAIFDKSKYVVAAVAKETCMQLGELFGDESGVDSSGKIVSILRQMGIDAVVSMEQLDDLYECRKNASIAECVQKGISPVFSSDCESWRRYVHKFYPQIEGHLLPIQSKREFLAEYYKNLFLEKDVYFVSMDNCLAAKVERKRPEYGGLVDAAITTRELFAMIRRACVSNFTAVDTWKKIPEESFDEIPKKPEEGATDVYYDTERVCLRFCVIQNLSELRDVIQHKNDFDYIEVKACPGGCKNGGGAPNSPGYKNL